MVGYFPYSFNQPTIIIHLPRVIIKVLFGGIMIPTLVRTVTLTYVIIDTYILLIDIYIYIIYHYYYEYQYNE